MGEEGRERGRRKSRGKRWKEGGKEWVGEKNRASVKERELEKKEKKSYW